jgi:hypothetical protein
MKKRGPGLKIPARHAERVLPKNNLILVSEEKLIAFPNLVLKPCGNSITFR